MARWYDPYLNHWVQPDSIIPELGKASAFDRYSYTQNNPIKLNDPSGHDDDCGAGDPGCKRQIEKEKVPHCKPGEVCKTIPENDGTSIEETKPGDSNPLIGLGFTETQDSKAFDFGIVSSGPITSININQPTPFAITSARENGEYDGFQVDSDYLFGSFNPINGDYGFGFRTSIVGSDALPNQFAFEYQYKNNSYYDSEMNFAVYPIDIQNNLQVNNTIIAT